jgi:FAD/FMN-containing dehydrogenase
MVGAGTSDTAVAELRGLAARLSGSVVRPDDPDFPYLRKSFLGRPGVEVLPRAVVRCETWQDVAEALGFARAQQLPFALRSGGHSFADFCTTDGLLIDLGPMDTVRLDAEVVVVGPGVRLGRLAERLAEAGRVVPCGWHPLVAVGGAVLGGGYGMLSRYFGLGCDQLLAAQVVLADGRMLWTDERREPELFWALRGAGWGSFGAVTALVLRTHPAPRVATFVHRWPWRQVTRVVDAWQRWAPEAPDEINAELVLQVGGQDPEPLVTLFGAVVGTAAQARPPLEEFLHRVEPGADLGELSELAPRVAASRYTYAGVPVATAPPPRLPPGYRPWLRVVKSEFFDQPMPGEAIEALVATLVADLAPGQYRELELIPWGGAFRRVPAEATAFVHRAQRFQIGHHGIGARASPEEQSAIHAWVGRSWRAVHRWASGAVYPNYPDPDLPDWARAYYGANLARLTSVKARYDPDDLFRFPQSIPLA